jgi:hypothetical protein
MSKKIVFTTKMVEEVTKQLSDGEQIPRIQNPWYKGEIGVRRMGTAFKMTPEETEEYIKCATDIHYFANNYCKIKLEDGSVGQMRLRDYQKEILDLYYDNKFSILCASRQVGKTVSAAIMILHFMTFNNDKGIMIMGNKLDTAIEIVDKVKSIYKLLPFFLQRAIKVWNQKSLTLDNGCRIKTSGRSKAPAIGFTIDLLYLDEFAHIPSTILEPFYRAAFPTVSAVENSKIIITSTPNGFNLFHKILTEAELEDDDPRKNTFKPMRVYWNQVPGRNVTYLRLNDFKLNQYYIDKDMVYDYIKELYDPNDEVNANRLPYVKKWRDYENSKDVINVLNDRVDVEEIRKLTITNKEGQEIPLNAIANISTWKEDTIKDIGGVQSFNQEYDLRFLSGAASILSEMMTERLLEIKEEFEHQPHDIFSDKLKWDYSNLRWIKDESLFTEANRKKYKIIMSIDISEGLGEDYSVIQIFRILQKEKELIDKKKAHFTKKSDFFKLKQIGLFRSNLVSVEQLAEMAYLLAFEYFEEENVKVVFELNNDGKTFKAVLPNVFEQNNNYGSHVMFRFKHRQDAIKEEIGIKVGKNKNHMVKDYVDMIEGGDIEVTEATTIKEITTFIKHQTAAGNIQYRADGSAHDDTVMPIVNITPVFKKVIYKDFVDDYFNEVDDMEFKREVESFLEIAEKSEGTDYGAFINATRNMKKYQKPYQPPNPFNRNFD